MNTIINIKYTSAKRDGQARFTSEKAFRTWLANHPEVRQYTIIRKVS